MLLCSTSFLTPYRVGALWSFDNSPYCKADPSDLPSPACRLATANIIPNLTYVQLLPTYNYPLN